MREVSVTSRAVCLSWADLWSGARKEYPKPEGGEMTAKFHPDARGPSLWQPRYMVAGTPSCVSLKECLTTEISCTGGSRSEGPIRQTLRDGVLSRGLVSCATEPS